MRVILFIFLIFISSLAFSSPADKLREEIRQFGVAAVTASDFRPGIYRHIVMFRYKDNVADWEKREIRKRFLALQQKCLRDGKPYIVSIETGTQNSGEGVDQGLQEAFVVTFKSEGDRNFYVGQPIITGPKYYDQGHQAFKDFVGAYLHTPVNPTGVVVFDYCVEAMSHLK